MKAAVNGAAWLTPLSTLDARLAKFSVQLDFQRSRSGAS